MKKVYKTLCCGLNVHFQPSFRILMLKSDPQCDSIWRWSLWEVIMFGWSHRGWAPIMDDILLSEGRVLCSVYERTIWSWLYVTQKRALIITWLFYHPDLRCSASRTGGNIFLLCIDHPDYATLLWKHELSQNGFQVLDHGYYKTPTSDQRLKNWDDAYGYPNWSLRERL